MMAPSVTTGAAAKMDSAVVAEDARAKTAPKKPKGEGSGG